MPTDKIAVMNQLKTHLSHFQEHFPDNKWVGIFLVGSQNYGLDDSGSDVDSKIIILPTLQDIALDRDPVSVILHLPNGEQAEVKDIRKMFSCYRKQNINFIETLFTEYRILNPKWGDLLTPLFMNNEKIARFNTTKAVDTMCGMIRERYKKFEKTLEKDGPNTYDGKNICTIMRISEFLDRYISGESYAECLKAKDIASLRRYKSCDYSFDHVCLQAKLAEERARGAAIYFHAQNKSVDKYVDALLDSVLLNVFYFLMGEIVQ